MEWPKVLRILSWMCESPDGVAEEWLCCGHVAGQLTTHIEAHMCLSMNTEALPGPGEARSLVGTNSHLLSGLDGGMGLSVPSPYCSRIYTS